MNSPPFFQDFQQRIADLVKASPAADLERNLKAMLAQTFSRLDLVTRDEYEMLETRLARLQARVEALEARLKTEASPPA